MRKTSIAIIVTITLAATGIGHGQQHRRPARRLMPAPDRAAESTLLHPSDLGYLGAFRLPGPSGGSNWEYSRYAMAYYREGDPGGPADGHPGSLFLIGHDHHQMISEISIPVPVISASKNPAPLNTAGTLQPFREITGGMFILIEQPFDIVAVGWCRRNLNFAADT